MKPWRGPHFVYQCLGKCELPVSVDKLFSFHFGGDTPRLRRVSPSTTGNFGQENPCAYFRPKPNRATKSICFLQIKQILSTREISHQNKLAKHITHPSCQAAAASVVCLFRRRERRNRHSLTRTMLPTHASKQTTHAHAWSSVLLLAWRHFSRPARISIRTLLCLLAILAEPDDNGPANLI